MALVKPELKEPRTVMSMVNMNTLGVEVEAVHV